MKAVLAGYGEVGRGLYAALSDYHTIQVEDPKLGLSADANGHCDILLVAIPYSKEFECEVKKLALKFLPYAIVVFSSVPIGTCSRLGAIHSPIEGQHHNMRASIRYHTRYLGGRNELVRSFFVLADLSIATMDKPEITEFMKLQSLAIFGINIQWTADCKKMADEIGFDFVDLQEYNSDHNDLVVAVHEKKQFVRYNLDPPQGKIGGHCILPGMKLLQESMDNPFIKRVLDFNEEGS